MSTIVIFDKNATPQNVVQAPLESVNTPDYDGRTDVVIFDNSNPPSNLDGLKSVPFKYWKHKAGKIVKMTIAEKTVVDDAAATQVTSSRRNEAEKMFDDLTGDVAIKALMLAMRDEFNRSRALDGVNLITKVQIKNTIINIIQSGEAD